ncbi:Holliday junction resolvase RuvX [Xylella taiwanensis]|uniref:Putative pre-16S rRNA nuclease n=1 Tax=Xylella taiwanensis TaxID=1444770 RepID=Z9JJ66_9GAMM|nr:Holliday junction resolvase RuvX [Xylella taiwanensis]AXI83750.1 Holliday junction resolvase [Xylella taiwanensis]EWS78219.1 Holliday junction resolvase [Xylella taiwanensis]MCD8456854.1 Holliday junction resolvase RuvX [Xylella taiwanensis]MCD8459263.1 Holliday junction resolvase RuvX [Xylella taiwanensis]MCD8461864.1 Holliday junction resolvase RuvX [Xylella taiwanensis]
MPEASPIFPDGIVLGFDVGTRRIGVAVGSGWGVGARAVAVIDVHGAAVDWNALDRVKCNWRPVGLVVGDPLTMDGQDQPMRKHVHAFARQLRERYRLPVVLVDERSSSVEAAHRFADARAAGYKRRRDADTLDAIAAAVIVERWFADPTQATSLP